MFVLSQVAPGTEPIQWSAPVPNDIDWSVLAACIIAGAALFAYGVHRAVNRWENRGWVGKRAPLYAELASYLLGPCFGGAAGYLVWHWGLGALCGLVGAWASPWVMRWLDQVMNRMPFFRKLPPTDGEDPKPKKEPKKREPKSKKKPPPPPP